MIFTRALDSLQEGSFALAQRQSAAGAGRNSKYVFALPARYNYAFPAGYKVEAILERDPSSLARSELSFEENLKQIDNFFPCATIKLSRKIVRGEVAQLVRVLRSHRRGQRFESALPHHLLLKTCTGCVSFSFIKPNLYINRRDLTMRALVIYSTATAVIKRQLESLPQPSKPTTGRYSC